MYKNPALLIAFLGCLLHASGQNLSNKRSLHFAYADSVALDSLSILPSTVELFGSDGKLMDASLYSVDYSRAILHFKQSFPGRQFTIFYRVFPLSLSGDEQMNFPSYAEPKFDSLQQFIPKSQNTAITEEDSRIQATGNLSRGISNGNGQNLNMTSNLNLQLRGELDEGVYLEAYLSDNNVPIQPNGYSQQINQFDQIYMRIYDKDRSLQMGDVDIKSSNSYFLRFQRRLLGGDFTGTFKQEDGSKTYAQASAAIAKGTFNREEVAISEGVQGPYTLPGAQSEQYVTILAGSERIYLDGVLLSRGEKADYVIDYNTAELTFMPKIMITKDARVIAEYEYIDNSYNRFLLYGQTGFEKKGTAVHIHYFSEGDAKNQTIDEDLTEAQKLMLSQAGDDYSRAIVPNIDSVSYSSSLVLYALVDTLVNGVSYDSVFVVSYDEDKAFFQLGFSEVGEGYGDYVRTTSTANGKVYQWVAPVDGVPQGSYAPVRQLNAPQKQRLLVVNATQQMGKHTNFSAELALSEQDSNTFSTYDDANNKGLALSTALQHTLATGRQQIQLSGRYDFLHANFSTPERFRSAEFNRDWNLSSSIRGQQHYGEVSGSWQQAGKERLSLQLQRLAAGNFTGSRIKGATQIQLGKSRMQASSSYLHSKDSAQQTDFYRHTIDVSQSIHRFRLGLSHDMEYNAKREAQSDSMLSSSTGYSQADLYLSSGDSSGNQFLLKYRNRMDLYPKNEQLQHLATAHNYSASASLGRVKNQLDLTATYRNLKVKDPDVSTSISDAENFLGRLEHQWRPGKQLFYFSSLYELGTGLVNRKEFVYTEVATGQGIYVWEDYNNNNIPELDEFEIAKFSNEANYIRVYTPTSDYTQAYTLRFNETFRVDPSRRWRNEKGWKGLAARFNNTLSYRMQQKQSSTDMARRLNPFAGQMNDTSLITQSANWRNTFSFNKRSPVFGLDYIVTLTQQKSLLSNGFETNSLLRHQGSLRWNLVHSLLWQSTINYDQKEYLSEYYVARNYLIEARSTNNSLQWQPAPTFRLSLSYSYEQKKNTQGEERSKIHEAGPEVKWNTPGKGTVSAQVKAVRTFFTGNEDTSISYEMLNGYTAGMNYKWSVNMARNLNSFLRLSLNYNGRAGTDISVIHTGSMTVVAFF